MTMYDYAVDNNLRQAIREMEFDQHAETVYGRP